MLQFGKIVSSSLCGAMTFLVLAVLVTGPAAVTADEVDPAEVEKTLEELGNAYDAAETPEGKLKVVQKFLSIYPESEYTMMLLDVSQNLLSGQLDDHAGAIAYTKEIQGQVQDPEIQAQIRLLFVDLYDRPEYQEELHAMAAELAAAGQESFSDRLRLATAASGAEDWDLVLETCAAAQPQANAQTFRADYPDRDFSDEYIQEAGQNRQALLGTYEGWALANQGEMDAALRTFAESEGLVRLTYLGVPDNDLYLYWGQALVLNQETDAGLEKLGLAAAWGFNVEAKAAALEAYIAENGNDTGFQDYMLDLRQRTAQTMSDFTLMDYEDNPQTLAQLKGKVTLLTFWFPT